VRIIAWFNNVHAASSLEQTQLERRECVMGGTPLTRITPTTIFLRAIARTLSDVA
jgi:hypothetical protein